MLIGRGDASDLGLACDAAVRILATRGVGALSVRAIAAEMNLTGPALTHRWDNKARLWGLLITRIGERWLQALERAVSDRGPAGMMPSTPMEVEDAQVWLCLSDLGRSDPDLSLRVADVADQERGLLLTALEATHEARLPGPVVDAMHAVAVGLRQSVCSVGQPMATDRAARAWQVVAGRG